MKRPRSYGEDLDERASWLRRDADLDRPPSHRRFSPKSSESARKASPSSSHDRASGDDDRDPPRPPPRKRFAHDSDGLERRIRYRDGSDRPSQLRVGGDRLHRSESFSAVPRREFPKGARSERERPRRDRDVSSLWRRSSSWKEGGDVEPSGRWDHSASTRSRDSPSGGRSRSPAAEPSGRWDHSASTRSRDSPSGGRSRSPAAEPSWRWNHPEERTSVPPKDSPSGGQSRSIGTEKGEEAHRESCSSSEMEEGELEPDREPQHRSEPSASPGPQIRVELSDGKDRGFECNIKSEEISGKKIDLESNMETEISKDEACEVKEEKASDVAREEAVENVDAMPNQDKFVRESIEERSHVGKEDDSKEVIGDNECKEKQTAPEEAPVVAEEEKGIDLLVSCPIEEKPEEKEGEDQSLEVEANKKEEMGVDLESSVKEGNAIDLEIAPVGMISSFDSNRDALTGLYENGVTLELMSDSLKEIHKDKGKSVVVASLSSGADSEGEEDPMERPSGRGFELVFCSDANKGEKAKPGGITIGKHRDEKCNLELLDLSLGLSNNSLEHTPKPLNPHPTSPIRTRSMLSSPSSFRTNSDAFTASISFSGSQAFTHNPSCSLNQNSLENYEQSVGSHPIFQAVNQVNGTIWQGQSSNEPKRKGGAALLFQKVLMNANSSHHSPPAVNGNQHLVPNGLLRQSSLPRQLSPAHSLGSNDTRSEDGKDKRLVTTERSRSILFRSEQKEKEGGQLALKGTSVIEKIFSKIMTEPLQAVSRMLQDMTEQSVAYLKETICETIFSANKHGQLQLLQEVLQRRADLTMDALTKCNRTLLEILVSLKTGLPESIQKASDVSSVDLVEIFLNMKCRNLACRSILPVDECDCKICIQKNGFCSACMCLVCSKFDMAFNTCSWVGCDVCSHWCHVDCGLRDSHIRNGQSASGGQGMSEMQFHCVACGHSSEMFGFVKEVFKTCTKDWKAETLAKELQYVRRIFSASNDVKGSKLRDVADQMMVKLEDKANLSEVINYIMAYFAESDSNLGSTASLPLREPSRNNVQEGNGIASSSKEPIWLPSISSDRVPKLERTGILSSGDYDQMGRKIRDIESQMSLKMKPLVDELDSVVRLKQAEAKMYQERADDARREADALKRIAVAKNARIDEDYASQLTKLRLGEAEERRRRKFEELQILERANHGYFNMKLRMDADIKDLLFKLEATKRNLNT